MTKGAATTNHRLQSVASIARGYDDSGNTTSMGGTAKTFEYNQAGRLSVVRANGTQTASYLYNGGGERVRRIAGGQTTLTLYGDAGQWLGDYDATGQPLQQAIWFDDLPVGLLTGASANLTLHYIEADALGTPRVVIDPTRNVAVWRWGLDGEAFGDSAPDQDPDNDGIAFVFDMRFPGQRYDSASGLNYNYYRDYDPATGRYVQSDPIGLAGGISTYGYVRGNSLTRIDLLGLEDSLTDKFNAALAAGNLTEAITIAQAGATPVAAALATKGQQIHNVVGGYLRRFPINSNQCEKAAKAIYDIFRYNGLAPQYLRIANAPRFRFVYLSERYMAPQHFSVRLGDRVFDATTGPSGMLYSEYVARLNAINLGPGSYLIQNIDDIGGYL